MDVTHTVMRKIVDADPNTYVIFFVYECPYCQKALELLRRSNVKYKGYNINDISGGMPTLLRVLGENAEKIGFDKTHRTKPIIFYDKKFLGGYDDLMRYFNTNQSSSIAPWRCLTPNSSDKVIQHFMLYHTRPPNIIVWTYSIVVLYNNPYTIHPNR